MVGRWLPFPVPKGLWPVPPLYASLATYLQVYRPLQHHHLVWPATTCLCDTDAFLPPPATCRYTAYLLTAASFGLWLTDQFIATTMINACKQMTQVDKSWGSFVRVFLERILKLALPTLGGFLVIFVAQFHLLLNLIAELLGFADREFYLVRLQLQHVLAFTQLSMLMSM